MMRVSAVTGGRADWGLLSPVLKALHDDDYFTLRIVATGQHLVPPQDSMAAIARDGFDVAARVDLGLGADDGDLAVTKALSCSVAGFADEFAQNRPDMLLVLGDRYEILGAVQAALVAKIPVAHLCGGDVTEGAMDDAIRHAITKMAHLHFVTNEEARQRVIRMGESPAQVHYVGSPGLDHMRSVEVMDRDSFFRAVGLSPKTSNIMVTFHPVTLETDSVAQCGALLEALQALGPDVGIVLTGSNADPQGMTLTRMVKDFAAEHDNAVFHETLGTQRYFNALLYLNAVVGNSSSGLYEAPSYGIATVNIGDRQKGRLKAKTVIDCAPRADDILKAVQKALAMPRGNGCNPYGDGHTAGRIVKILKDVKDPQALCRKVFYDGKEDCR